MSRPEPTLAQELAAALAWWQMAGVDLDFTDDVTTWLAEQPMAGTDTGPALSRGGRQAAARSANAAEPPAMRQVAANPDRTAPAAPARRNLLGESPPADLAAFHSWWTNTADLSPSRGFPRIAPRGAAGAALMVLVPEPEAEDEHRLLSGPQGRLLSNILGAIGLDESAVYIASALPSHTPIADFPSLAASGMDEVTLHHIRLVAPARLLVFGSALTPMLGAGDAHQSDYPLREINQTGCKVPVTVSETLDTLMNMPRLKARFWRRWMEWSATH